MSVTPTERKAARAEKVAQAVRRARERRDYSLRELARRSGVSASTLSRMENPESAESPQVETLEAIAATLRCPLVELLGESVTIEYRGIGGWPEALKETLTNRGGYITPAERSFIEHRLAAIHDLADEAGTAAADEKAKAVLENPKYWESQLSLFRESPLWRTVALLVDTGWALPVNAMRGVHLVVEELVSTWAPPEAERGPLVEARRQMDAAAKRYWEEQHEHEKEGGDDG